MLRHVCIAYSAYRRRMPRVCFGALPEVSVEIADLAGLRCGLQLSVAYVQRSSER